MATLRGTPGPDHLPGTAEADALYGLGGNDLLEGGPGDDLFVGGHGDDHLEGGEDFDTASWGDAPGRGSGGFWGMWISLAAGLAEAAVGQTGDGFWQRAPNLERDSLAGIEGLKGSTRHDYLGGDGGANLLHGLAGRDELEGLAGDDRLYGDAGDDLVRGGAGQDVLHGGGGADEIDGGIGDDVAYGGAGDDTLVGDLGADRLYGGEGEDRFLDGSLEPGGPEETGSDRYDGRDGVDTVDYHRSTAADGAGLIVQLTDSLAPGTARQGEEIDRLLSIENVIGSERNDVIVGNDAANLLTGLGGDDRLYGRGGDDILIVGSEARTGADNFAEGGAGDDLIRGWGGSDDRLLGGSGADRLEGGSHALAEVGDSDRLELGRDFAADQARFELSQSVVGLAGGGVDRVYDFDPTSDLLDLHLRRSSAFGPISVVDVGDFLDSDDNGVLDEADQEVSALGPDLMLDLGSVWERAFAVDLPDDRPQQVVLVEVASLEADRVMTPQLEPGWQLVTEPADFLL